MAVPKPKVSILGILFTAFYIMAFFNGISGAFKCMVGEWGKEVVEECPRGTTKCLTLLDCLIPAADAERTTIISGKGCVSPGQDDPCREELPGKRGHHGQTLKEMCGFCDTCNTELCNGNNPPPVPGPGPKKHSSLQCYEDEPDFGGVKEKKCPVGTTKCLTLTDCRIPGQEGLHSRKACLYPDPGGDPCRTKVPRSGIKTYKEMCRECATCNTKLCNEGKGGTDKGRFTAAPSKIALQCYTGQGATGEVTNCSAGTKGCVVALDCGPGGFIDYRDCSASEDPCNVKLPDNLGGDTPNAVCNSCKFCRDNLCNKNGSAGIFRRPQLGLVILALLLGSSLLKMLMVN